MTTFPHRLMGASVLDVATYEEVEADRTATAQAFLVVLASSLAGGIGATGLVREGTPLVAGVFFWSAVTLIAWAAWALLVFEIGGRLLPEPATRVDVGELLRTIGSHPPPGLRVFGVFRTSLPVFALRRRMLVAMVVAVGRPSTMNVARRRCLTASRALIIAAAFGIFSDRGFRGLAPMHGIRLGNC
jgi:hypothetical protein